MATTMLYPPVPLGYDYGLPDSFLSSDLPSLQELGGDMTDDQFSGDAVPSVSYEGPMEVDGFEFVTANESSDVQAQSSTFTGTFIAASNASMLMSPAGATTVVSHQASDQSTAKPVFSSLSDGSSRSPGTTSSQILTPASTHLDYNASINGSNFADEDDQDNFSPVSDSDYVLLPRNRLASDNLRPGPQATLMSNRHPQSSEEPSGASDAQYPSRASSVASFAGGQWGSMNSSGGPFMDNRYQQQGAYNNPALLAASTYPSQGPTYTSASQGYGDVSSDLSSWDTSMFNTHLPFRAGSDQQGYGQNIYGGSSNITPHLYQHQAQGFGRTPDYALQQHQQAITQQARMRQLSGNTFPPALNIPSTASLMVQPQANPLTAPAGMEQRRLSSSPMPSTFSVPRASIPNASYQPQYIKADPYSVDSNMQHAQSTSMRTSASSVGQSKRPLQAANTKPHTVPSNARASNTEQGRKGGRQRGAHLDKQQKEKSSRMRKVVACWRCALQRDPCDDGSPCKRCMMRAQKGQPYFFQCDRSKLPDFVHDFLPQATMTLMHQKQTIQDTVSDQVVEWDLDRPIDVYLESGYGPPLRWKLYEFKPRTRDLLGQFQYLQDPKTGTQQRIHKYSPPLGLSKLDATDDQHVEEYLKRLLEDDCLLDLGWSCFEEESQVDGEDFQATLLACMCELYTRTRDEDLKHLLQETLRMIIITYIMGHTLTITEGTLSTVLDHVKHSAKPKQYQTFTSPRLANRQLKFYFSLLRANIYERILKWQQQTFHTSGKKEDTWLHSFCAMLGFAMVLEEVQRTILIQMDAKIAKAEMSYEEATKEASNACERIDERFTLLVGLFQCKYRDRKWGDNGSFGPATPQYDDKVANKFLEDVRFLLLQRSEHLQRRRNVQFEAKNQCLYTSRLVARFLLPFLNLPHG